MQSMPVNEIYCIDCIEGMKTLDPQSIDIIVTSPPYNIGIEYNSYSDEKPRDEYLKWMGDVAKESKRVLKNNGSFFLNIGGTLKDPWVPIDVALEFRCYCELQNTIHWIKSIAIPKEDVGNYPNVKDDIAVGHYKPINSKRYHHDCHEYIWHFTKNGDVELDKIGVGVPYQDKTNITRWKGANGSDKRDRGNTWFIPYETIRESRPHPSTFPIKLPEMCIKDHGIDNSIIVLDPFMGIGNTAIACLKLGVKYIGFEIDKQYIEIAKERIKKEENSVQTLKKISAQNITRSQNSALSSFF